MIVKIKDVLEKIIESQLEIPRALEEYRVASIWRIANTDKVASNSMPDKLIDGVLYINARNSTWAQQISISKAEIITNLNNKLGRKVIKDIRVRTGPVGSREDEDAKDETRNCGSCGVEFAGKSGLCQVCSRKQKQARNVSLTRLLVADPKIGLSDAKDRLPGIEEADFRRAKRDINARKKDKEYTDRRQRGR